MNGISLVEHDFLNFLHFWNSLAMVPEGHIVSMYSIYSVFCRFKLIFKLKHLKFPAFFESQLKPKHWKHMENETKVQSHKIKDSSINS